MEVEAKAERGEFPLRHGYLFAQDGSGRHVDAPTALDWLRREAPVGESPPGRAAPSPAPEGGEFLWLHCHEFPSASDGWAELHLEVPERFGHVLKDGSRSTRIAHVRQSLIAVINDVEYDFERKAPPEVATLWVNVSARCLLSVRSQPLRSVDELRLEIEAGRRFHSPMALLIHLLQKQADVLFGIFRNAAVNANLVDDALRAGRLPRRSSLGGVRRDLVRLRRLLAPEPAALFRLVSRPPQWVRDDDAQALRQSAEDFSVAVRDMAGLQERIKLLEEEIADSVGERTNRNVLILTAVTVIALPVNVLAALFGMNIGGLPLRNSAHGFLIVAVLATLLTGIAIWLIRRLARA
jgi:zinc transporter